MWPFVEFGRVEQVPRNGSHICIPCTCKLYIENEYGRLEYILR